MKPVVNQIDATASGKRMIARAMLLWRRAQNALDAGLGKTGIEALHQEIDRASARLQESALA